MTRLPQETENWALINAIDESRRWSRSRTASSRRRSRRAPRRSTRTRATAERDDALAAASAARAECDAALAAAADAPRAVSPTLGAGDAPGRRPRHDVAESWAAVTTKGCEVAEAAAELVSLRNRVAQLEASNKRFQRAARDDAFRRDKLVADSRHKLAEKESAHASAVETMRDGSKTAAEIVNPMMDENDSLMYENASLKARDQEREREFVALERKNDDLRAEVERLTERLAAELAAAALAAERDVAPAAAAPRTVSPTLELIDELGSSASAPKSPGSTPEAPGRADLDASDAQRPRAAACRRRPS
ncbi:hypothetical protein JL722_5819 [Aureococcus anophagefferens]|nr:hypothetical protein JL722_5819 [Aureococcus anophagefferens]